MQIIQKTFFLILFVCLIKTTIAQEKVDSNCSIRILNESTKFQVDTYLKRQKALINIKLAKDCSFKDDSVFLQLTQITENQDLCNSITQKIDSILIVLDNGIYWNLDKEPPKEPKRFYTRMLTKKGQENQEVVDRIHYLQFCSRFDNSNDSPCSVSDIYKVYTQIKYMENTVLKAVYKIDFKNELTEIIEFQPITN